MVVNVNRHWRWLFPVLIISIAVSTIFICTVGISGDNSNEPVVPAQMGDYVIFPVEVPQELDFAGESVPLQLFDVREALDRELLSNTFFHSQTIRLMKLANRYFPVIEPLLEAQGIPEDFKYMAVAESGLSNVVSPANAVGFWQIRKGTATDYGLEVNSEVDERYHLEKSTIAACKYLKESYEQYGNWTMTAASYNAGRRGIDREIVRQKPLLVVMTSADLSVSSNSGSSGLIQSQLAVIKTMNIKTNIFFVSLAISV